MDIDDRKLVAWINPTDGSTPILTVDAVTNNTRIGSHGSSVVLDKAASIPALDNTPIGQTTPAAGTFSTVNSWTPTFVASDLTTLVSGGTGHAAGDILTLPNGVKMAVVTVSVGVITSWTTLVRGSASSIPANPATQASTTGTGVGASFNLAWAPQSTNSLGGTLASNAGSLFIGGEQPSARLSGSENTFLGVRAGGGFTGSGAVFNTCVGHNAGGIGAGGTGTATAGQNTFIGNDAGRNVTGATAGNTAIGTSAGRNISSASGACTFVGYNAGRGTESSVTGAFNTGVGNQALGGLQNMTSAANNTAVGDSALTGLTTGSGNTAIGLSAGAAVTSATNNTAVGLNALLTAITGANNTAVGANALKVVTGSGNTAIGATAGFSATGNDGLFVGEFAGQKFTGGQNTILGPKAGGSATGGAAAGNVLVGYQTGLTLTSGSNNVLLGPNVASVTLATGSGNIYVGASSAIDAGTGAEANTFRLGNHATNLLRATGINTATPAFFFDWIPASTTFASDAAAATGGVSVGQVYRNGSNICVRIA